MKKVIGFPVRNLSFCASLQPAFSKDCFSNLGEEDMGFSGKLMLNSSVAPNVAHTGSYNRSPVTSASSRQDTEVSDKHHITRDRKTGSARSAGDANLRLDFC